MREKEGWAIYEVVGKGRKLVQEKENCNTDDNINVLLHIHLKSCKINGN